MSNSSNNKSLIEEPIYPEDWECCNNGCEEMCVYEIYRVQKQAYDKQQAEQQRFNAAKLAKPAD